MGVVGEAVEKRVAVQVAVETRQPVRVRDPVLRADGRLAGPGERAERLLDIKEGILVDVGVVLVLEILFVKVVVAQCSDLRLQSEAFRQFLNVHPVEEAAAPLGVVVVLAAIAAENVGARVFHAVGAKVVGRLAGHLEERQGRGVKGRAERRAALAQVIDVHVPA